MTAFVISSPPKYALASFTKFFSISEDISIGVMSLSRFGQLMLISSEFKSSFRNFLSILCVESFSPLLANSLRVLPIILFTEVKVFFGLSTCCRRAFSPKLMF